MPTVLDWNPTVDPSEFVRQVRESLAAGLAVVLPGDSGYVALINPACPAASEQIRQVNEHPSVLAYGFEEASALGLTVPDVARRLMFRAWPAPLAVELAAEGFNPPTNWPLAVCERLVDGNRVRLRCPEHPVFEGVFPALDGLTLVVDTFQATAEAALDLLDENAGLAVAAGIRDTSHRPTVVNVDSVTYTITETGTFAKDEIERLAARIVLFVCTGNTCRSPLAEGLAKKLLAARLSCSVADLPARGFWLLSAGVAAYGGSPASAESLDIASEFGVDLGSHRSRPINPQLLAAADDIIAMTAAHAHSITARYPEVSASVRLLCGEHDLDDPIGAGLDVYRDCAQTIQAHLERLIPEWVVL